MFGLDIFETGEHEYTLTLPTEDRLTINDVIKVRVIDNAIIEVICGDKDKLLWKYVRYIYIYDEVITDIRNDKDSTFKDLESLYKYVKKTTIELLEYEFRMEKGECK